MKPLSDITHEDALAIVNADLIYRDKSNKTRWKLTDESEDLDEPCKRLKSRTKIMTFWFMGDGTMNVELEFATKLDAMDETVVDNYTDMKLACYLKAHELGYYVKGLSEYLSPHEEMARLADSAAAIIEQEYPDTDFRTGISGQIRELQKRVS